MPESYTTSRAELTRARLLDALDQDARRYFGDVAHERVSLTVTRYPLRHDGTSEHSGTATYEVREDR